MIPALLGTKNPNDFKSKKVIITKTSEGYDIIPTGEPMSFKKMSQLRHPVNPNLMKNFQTYEFANIGVSTLLTLIIDNIDYLVLAPTPNENMAKLISGYIDFENILHPENQMDTEIAEEFLLEKPSETILRGKRLTPKEGFKHLSEPYSSIIYSSERPFEIISDNTAFSFLFRIPGLIRTNIRLEGRLLEEKPSIYFSPDTNSAQLVYHYYINLQKGRELSLHHAEDIFEPATGELSSVGKEYGMLLARIRQGKLTGELFSLRHGKLYREEKPNLLLSEVFGLRDENSGVTEVRNISIRDYFKQNP